MSIHEITEGLQYQSADERIVYTVTTTNWVASPTTPTVAAFDETMANLSVAGTIIAGTASVSGDVITLPACISLTRGHLYRIEVKWVVGSSTYECFFKVNCDF